MPAPLVPLHFAPDGFVQALVTSFELHRDAAGVRLELRLEPNDETIVDQRGKRAVRDWISELEGRAPTLQAELDAFLLEGHGDIWRHDDPSYPMRWASGGTLPIVRVEGRPHAVMMYREIFPIGWNLANGGTSSLAELLDPRATVRRELREELLLIDGARSTWVEPDLERELDRDELDVARGLWANRLGLAAELPTALAPVTWYTGPDTTSVSYSGRTTTVTGLWLVATAVDFGLEVDQVAEIDVDPAATLLSGEVVGGRLLDAPVGLFELDRLRGLVADGASRDFEPDHFWFGGERHPGPELDEVVTGPFLAALEGIVDDRARAELFAREHRYDLCPVSRRVLTRALPLRRS